MNNYSFLKFNLVLYKSYLRPFMYVLLDKVINYAEKNDTNDSIEYINNLILELVNPFILPKESVDKFMNNYQGNSEIKDMIKESLNYL